MSARLEIRLASALDCRRLANRMRPDDIAEIRAMSGRAPIDSLLWGLRWSREAWVATVDNEPMCIWGVVGGEGSVLGGQQGLGWLLTSDVLDDYPLMFWRASKQVLAGLLDRWASLTNMIDCRHEKALRWAQRLGFHFETPRPFGVLGLQFQQFTVSRGDLRYV